MDRLSAAVCAVLERGGCVVSADPHQAYQLRLAWAEHQQRHGSAGWPSPDILSVDAMVARAWQRALIDDPATRPILLSAAQERTLWEQVVRGRRGEQFLQPHGTARAAQRSWRRLQNWNLDLRQSGAWTSEESRSFLQWARAFEQRCDSLGVIDAPRALALVPPPATSGRPWILVGFDIVPPALRSLLQRWRETGIDIAIDEGHAVDARVSRAGFSDRQAEWRAAALWARHRLLEAPGQRLMIVIPDVERERDLVERTFDEILRPPALIDAAAPTVSCHAIEGGIALSEYPLVATAIAAAALASGPQPFDVASAWWR
jgi:ATP-dependent helicase/nuclease subunit B